MRKSVPLLVGMLLLPFAAQAQTYPHRSITMVVPFPAGGPSDVVARILAEHMARTLAQPLVIENVGGAGGTLGSAPRGGGRARWLLRYSPAAWARTSRPPR